MKDKPSALPETDQPRRRFMEHLVATGSVGAMLPLAMASQPALAQGLPATFVTLYDFGAVGNGTTDDTAAVQAAVDAAASGTYQAIYVTKGVYKLTSPIIIRRGISLIGEGCEPYKDIPQRIRGNGSWFYIAHTGIGFNIRPDGQTPAPHDLSGFTMKSIGTYRNQPTPTAGAYTPAANDWDIYIANSDVLLEDLTLLNPTKAIYVTNAIATPPAVLYPFARISIRNIRGQPLTFGLVIDNTKDVAHITDIHWWAFWAQNNGVINWQLANLVGIQFARCDAPYLSNIFSWATHIGLKIIDSGDGTTNTMTLTNTLFDNTHVGLLVDSSADGMTAQFTNLVIQGPFPYAPLNAGVQIDASNCALDFVNLSSSVFNANAVLVNGTGNVINITNIRSRSYDGAGAGYPAVQVAAGNSLFVTGISGILYVPTAKWFGGNGNISCHLGSGTVTTTTDVGGFAQIIPSPTLACDPRRVFIQPATTYLAAMVTVDMLFAGFIRVRFYGPNGAPLVNTAVSFHWRAEY
jgi:hypothetical protein